MIMGTCSNVGGWVLTLNMDLSDAYETLTGSDSAVVESLSVPVGVAMAETVGGLVDAVAEVDRTLAKVSAWRAELIDQARRCSELSELVTAPVSGPGSGCASGWDARTLARKVLVSELACSMRVPERTVEALVAESEALMHELPGTLGALGAGLISYRHAQTLIDHASSLPVDARGAFEVAVLPHAKKLTVSKFDRKARDARERVHPETIMVRHQKCAGDRLVQFQPARDGMAWLNAYLPAVDADAIYNRVSDMAVSLQAPGEARTLTQLRVDVFAGLLIDAVTPSGLGLGVRAQVQVTVPVLTLLGRSEEPGSLEGYGPIDPDTARRLAGHAPSFTRLLTHPETGCVLSVGRTRYKVPKDLRRWLRVRDETCRFPGCNRGAARCDIDHGKDWQYGGLTEHANLAHLCKSHHKLKSETRWTVKPARDGTLNWTSPSGHQYSTEPATHIRPAPAPPF